MGSQLIVTFSGICTHFYNCIQQGPGDPPIPLRSVLPNAIGVHFGLVQLPPTSAPPPPPPPPPVGYYLMPHSARYSADGGKPQLLYGATIEVLNVDPTQGAFTFTGLSDGYHLPDYVPDAVPSPDVVLNYNAACYFDFKYGSGQVLVDTATKMRRTTVTVNTTDDVPRIQITPFPGSPMVLDPNPFIIPCETLSVANQGFDLQKVPTDKGFDFMLNYLVTKGGIPQLLTQNTPGMGTPQALNMATLGQNVINLGTAIQTLPQGSGAEWLASLVSQRRPEDMDQSCSDSHYP